MTRLRQRPPPQGRAPATEKAAPGDAVSTTLAPLLTDGSDQAFRRLIYDLLALSNAMLKNRSHFAAYINVTDQQFMIMSLLHESPGAAVSQIAKRINVSSQFVTLETGKLVQRGILEKRENEHDRRRVALYLTARGQDLLKDVWPLRRETNDRTFRSLTTERAFQFAETVSALLLDAKSALHELESPRWSGRKAPSLDPEPDPALYVAAEKLSR